MKNMNKIPMDHRNYYGVANLPDAIFKQLNPDFFIFGCTDNVKYMCANEEERRHLSSLGIDVDAVPLCDYYKLVSENSK